MYFEGSIISDGLEILTESGPLQRGGCENAEEVAAAFRRIVQNGMKGGPIHPMDLLTVRSCGQRVVETFRKKAMEVCHKEYSLCMPASLQASKKGGLPS